VECLIIIDKNALAAGTGIAPSKGRAWRAFRVFLEAHSQTSREAFLDTLHRRMLPVLDLGQFGERPAR
jgi:hypothetical protein